MKKYWILVLFFLIGLAVSGIHPHDYFTWILEVFPGIIGFVVLLATFHRFRFSYFVYCLILVHCYILFIGGHYTYAEVPLFNWVRDVFHQSRNNYDKVGHFAQGFVPALIAREIFIRRRVVKPGAWVPVLTVGVCGAISALYELFEWLVAELSGQSSDSFLGTQGDIWDTQSDMLFAFIGATCAVLLFAHLHNRMMAREGLQPVPVQP